MSEAKVSATIANTLLVNLDALTPYDEDPSEPPRFVTPVYVRLERDDTKTVLADVVYHSKLTGKVYVVPAGFNTDFASVPRIPIAFLLTGGTADRPAIIHDFLYRTGVEDRKTCDAIFAEAMAATGVPGWRKSLMHLGVRIGGHNYYKTSPSVAEPAKEGHDVNNPPEVGD